MSRQQVGRYQSPLAALRHNGTCTGIRVTLGVGVPRGITPWKLPALCGNLRARRQTSVAVADPVMC
jgi:hypothetical protein